MKRESHLKALTPINRSIGPGPDQPLGQRGQRFDFSIFVHFLVLWSPPALFSWNPQFFMLNAKRILIFGPKFDHFLSICLYEAYGMKFMQSEGVFIKNLLSNY